MKKLTKIGIAFVVALIVLFLGIKCLVLFHPCPIIGGLKWKPTLSFEKLEKTRPFIARVESKETGFRPPYRDVSTGALVPSTNSVPFIHVDLVKPNGEGIAIYQEEPDSNQITFVAQLREGQQYNFPEAFLTWQKNHGFSSNNTAGQK
jgi:hypothetical protein